MKYFNPLSPHGERLYQASIPGCDLYFNPLSPRGERLTIDILRKPTDEISIHSPRMGRDGGCPRSGAGHRYFNPLSPHGERHAAAGSSAADAISIHSPRMGRDGICYEQIADELDFNPLSPHGERPVGASSALSPAGFQSTLPAWGETYRCPQAGHCIRISIHSPRMGRDPDGGRVWPGRAISIHSPRMGRDHGRVC